MTCEVAAVVLMAVLVAAVLLVLGAFALEVLLCLLVAVAIVAAW